MTAIKFIGGFVSGIAVSILLEIVLFQQFIDKIFYNSGYPISNLVDEVRLIIFSLLTLFALSKIKELRWAFLYGYILSAFLLVSFYIALLGTVTI
ncbi:MAG: hypothetical protein AAB350_00950 [Patescibacteria group bacterium]